MHRITRETSQERGLSSHFLHSKFEFTWIEVIHGRVEGHLTISLEMLFVLPLGRFIKSTSIVGTRKTGGFCILRRSAKCAHRPILKAARKKGKEICCHLLSQTRTADWPAENLTNLHTPQPNRGLRPHVMNRPRVPRNFHVNYSLKEYIDKKTDARRINVLNIKHFP